MAASANHDLEKPNHMIIWLDRNIGDPREYVNLKKAFGSITDRHSETCTMLTDRDYDVLLRTGDAVTVTFSGVAFHLIAFTNVDACLEAFEKYQDKRIFFITSGSMGQTIVPIIIQRYRPIFTDLFTGEPLSSIYIFCLHLEYNMGWAMEYADYVQMFNSESELLERMTRDIAEDYIKQSTRLYHGNDLKSALQNLHWAKILWLRYDMMKQEISSNDPKRVRESAGMKQISKLIYEIETTLMDESSGNDDAHTSSNMEYQTSIPERLQSFALVWLASDDTATQSSLDDFKNIDGIKSAEIYRVPFECISRLSDLKNEKVILILSNLSAKNVIAIVHDMINVLSIYLFSNNPEIDLQTMNNYSKFRGAYSDLNTLVSKILSDTKTLTDKADKKALFTDENQFISIYNSTKVGTLTEKFNETGNSFLQFQILADILSTSTEWPDMYGRIKAIEMCREFYKDNPIELNKIDEFNQSYEPGGAIRWYTRDCFLPRLLNKAFRNFNLDFLFAFRFFIVDVYNQLNEIYKEWIPNCQKNFQTFTGTLLTANEVQNIKNNIGNLVSINTFFDTYFDSAIALIFSGEGQARPQMESVLFQINIDSKANYIKPFADIRHLSVLRDEQEVLFSFGFVFRIESLDFDEEMKIWYVRLNCTDEVQTTVREIIDRFKIDLGTPINYITFGNILNKLNKPKEAEDYCKMLLQMHLTSKDVMEIKAYLINAYFLQGKYHLALEYYQEALRTPYTDLSTFPQVYYNIGCIYQRLHDFNSALRSFQSAIEYSTCQSSDLAKSYNNIAEVYAAMDNKDSALENYHKALNIALQILPSGHPLITQYLDNIASLERRISKADDVTSTAKRFQDLNTTSDQSDVTSTTKDLQSLRDFNDPCYDPPS